MEPLSLLALLAVAAGPPAADPPDPDRIYGRVTTAAGEVHEGYIRWDDNEGSWSDILHGSKELPSEYLQDAERAGLADRDDDDRIEILGLRISWGDEGFPRRAASGIRFGHLRSLRVLDDDLALLTLKSGQEIELRGGSSDVGSGNRGITVTDRHGDTVEFRWRDLERIDFRAAPGGDLPPGVGRRLHGTLHTRDAGRYTGYVAWDADEILTTDVLDGDDEDGRDREIPFGEIAAIEGDGASGARVVLRGGEELRLTGSNDVDHRNRGISVSDPTLGQVTVEWDEFESLDFTEPERFVGYDAFDGGAPLNGTVIDEEGNAWSGRVRWDNDESHSWELLNGDYGGAEFEVELSNVSWIRRRSSRVAEVLLRDGRVLELEGSNDVDRRNKGIFVTTESGEVVAVPWEELRELRLSRE